MTKRLGCISIYGIIAALLALLVVSGVALARGGVWFSPGALNGSIQGGPLGGVRSHAETGGECRLCHPAPWDQDLMADRCLACHTDLVDSPKDFHRIMLAEAELSDCTTCHSDHDGHDGALTRVEPGEFPHDQVGYSLAAHQELNGAAFKCSDCHAGDLSSFDPARCATCHAALDETFMLAHLVDFGEDCRSCHDGVDRYGEGFDHNRLAFPLEGEHANVQCAACHPSAGSMADLQAASQACAACHQDDDPHQGDLGSACQACHTPLDWEQATFDHALAASTSTCFACHESDDPHQGEFGQECGACHTTTSWLPAEFDHSKSQFPLTGAHMAVQCSGCHQDGVYKGTPAQCSACHVEPEYHLGAFGMECDACHTTSAWSPAKYDRPHTFPIDHGEQGNTRRTCHPSALTVYTCTTCHEQSEIAGKHQEEGIRDFADCTRCHATGQEHDEGGEGGEGGEDD